MTEPYGKRWIERLLSKQVASTPSITDIMAASGMPRTLVRRPFNSLAHTGFQHPDGFVLVRYKSQGGSRYEWRPA